MAATILSEAHPDVATHRPPDLGRVVELLEPSGGLNQLERARLASQLLTSAPDHPLIARALLQTMLPGLVSVARKLRWGDGSGDDASTFLSDLVTMTFELIVEWGGAVRPYAAPDILNAVRCRMRRRLEGDRRAPTPSLERADGSTIEVGFREDDDPTESLESKIAAIQASDPVGAAGLLGRAVLGLSYREIAAQTGHSPRALADASRTAARRILG
jgi:hypothetical protein